MNSEQRELLFPPTHPLPYEQAEGWFLKIAESLLNRHYLVVEGVPHRFAEVEFYYFGGAHRDSFTHCDELQKSNARWYFHRMRGSYKGGSFKGLDISFGDGEAFGGMLIRSLEVVEEDRVIDGPSLCVDHLLRVTGAGKVAALDALINQRSIWDTSSPLHLQTAAIISRDIVQSARVGLTLKKRGESAERQKNILRPYRFFNAPEKIKKGKIYYILALHKAGLTLEEIRAQTRSPRKSIARHIENFEQGKTEADFAPFIGSSLKSSGLASLHGVWDAHYSSL